jgi:hypothetical protein
MGMQLRGCFKHACEEWCPLTSKCAWLAAQLPQFDTRKVREELGLEYMDVRDTAQDMAASLIELGIIKRLPGAPKGPTFYSKL